MRFLLIFLPLFTYGQTFKVLVLDGDTMFVAPLDTMRYALSLREAADSVIVVERVGNINRAIAVSELSHALEKLERALANCNTACDLEKKELERTIAELRKEVDRLLKSNKRLKTTNGIGWGIGLAGLAKEGIDQLNR